MIDRCDVAVIGASGYTGEELLRILLRHPRVRLTAVTSRQAEGKPLSEVAGPAALSSPLVFEDLKPSEMAARAEVFFLALPHGVAAEFAVPLLQAGRTVFDLSADFRLKNPASYREFYHTDHPAPDLLGQAVYGLPETHARELAGATLVACPGCYPTNAVLGLAPALALGWIDPQRIVINSLSGISGAGKKADTFYSFAERSENLAAYSVPVHRHLPEIEQELAHVAGQPCRVSFVPHLVPVIRGMLGTLSAPLLRPVTQEQAQAAFEAHYAGSAFVKVMAPGKLPETKQVTGTNLCLLSVRVDAHAERLIVVSATDNLGKGAAGQAVQAFNLRMGWPETTGLL
ncbi:MAG: N-acetyl-gamma-glutamyl-phosphate reductase [Candidatus Methylacidiphilales bacterium]|nr:N-acetyl-gamma-glutamyl-phosphate reductase [Candidatus Methylacidiphilales bacterium]